jgi:membrane protease YdiL (CAAX protease family)
MEEREGFVENSKVAVKGIVNGIFGSFVYELILSFFMVMIVSSVVAAKNPGATQEQLSNLTDNFFSSFSFSVIVSCLGSVATLVVFIVLIKFEKFKEICKKAINIKTIKYGCLGALCIIGFSVIYNSLIIAVFNLNSDGNSNQNAVVNLIENNAFIGLMRVVILAPIVEELTYRYCLFGAMSRKKKWIGYLTSGIVFMLMHSISSFITYGIGKDLLIEFLYLPPYLFSGLALCYIYDKSDNLGSSFLAHMLNNLISFLSVIL